MGKLYLASSGHISELIATVPIEKHGLTPTLLNSKDKMNFKAVLKLCERRVIDQLREKISGSEGTATYVEMIKGVMDPYLDPTLSPLDRIGLMFEWVFFLRLWKKYVSSTEGYTVNNNFVTANAHSCVEVNAHSLVGIIRFLRDSERPHLLLLHLLSSQTCESSFRAMRSMTSTQSTVVNFSLLELEQRVHRIDFVKDSFIHLRDTVRFPRAEKNGGNSTQSAVILTPCLEIPKLKLQLLRRSNVLFDGL